MRLKGFRVILANAVGAVSGTVSRRGEEGGKLYLRLELAEEAMCDCKSIDPRRGKIFKNAGFGSANSDLQRRSETASSVLFHTLSPKVCS